MIQSSLPVSHHQKTENLIICFWEDSLRFTHLTAGLLHLEDCPGQPLLPVWHIVAGSTGLLVPLLYLLFDDLNPALAVRCPGLSEALDNVVVFVLPGETIGSQ